jgi:FtsH-binding integral membrane protein
MILLGVFSSFLRYLSGAVPSAYDLVAALQAFIIALGIIIEIILFALQTKYDFFGFTPHLYSSLLGIIIAGLVHLFLPYNSWKEALIAPAIALVCSEYFISVIQTNMDEVSGKGHVSAVKECYALIFEIFYEIGKCICCFNC